jgi:molybdenum cofactor cytidylyltransferase
LRPLADVVIIEADGARGLPLKAPAAHEPVVPRETTLFIPVCGITALGRELTAHAVHRPELVAGLTGLACGELVTDEAIVRLLLNPLGGLKGAPARARVQPLINQVSNAESLAAARRIAARVKVDPYVDRVLIGAVATKSPVLESWRRVAAVVLAAGESRRLGRPKQLLRVGQTTMIEHVLRAVLGAHLDQVVVVLGSRAAEIAPHVTAGTQSVLNADWSSGISSSIRAGLSAVASTIEAALFVLADQPHLTSTTLERIVQAYYGTEKSIVVPACQGRRGSPVLFDRRHFDELKALHGDVGGRAVAQRHAECVLEVELETDETLTDIDTLADYESFLKAQSDASTCT